ncbi:spore coat protein [Rummeliibacillus stabekisii]|uniref:CotD family spore coat protein n=1 Tax=Rummeliibacillus TaxID=648802 RepID=UPI001CC22BB1|nr:MULTISPECIES: CotD family spore coat protein [Rummeliibacillus]MCM3317015.1 spore coat protein [Rummeliibacillus stabekisii]
MNRRHPHHCQPCNMPEFCPPHMLPAQYDPPRVSPTRQVVRTNIIPTVVPHIHPTHVTTVNRHVINNQHYFPQTHSVVEECVENNTVCPMPMPHPRHQMHHRGRC